MRQNYFGARALLTSALGSWRCTSARPLDTAGLVEAAVGCQIIIADRATACAAEAFAALPELAAVCRVAVDIRNIDVAAAGSTGC